MFRHQYPPSPPLNLPELTCTVFSIAKSHFTYLGIKIGKVPSSLYQLNFLPALFKISAELESWSSLPLSLFSRWHLFKMFSFPKLLYPLQTTPLLLKHKDIQKLQKALSIFLWKGGRPRISLQKLYLPKHEGGADLPNMQLYYVSWK